MTVMALLGLLLGHATAAARSGLPATITMHPPAAGPGALVEVVGIDFAGGVPIVLELARPTVSPDGPAAETGQAADLPAETELAVIVATEGGYFRELVRLPADMTLGWWELRASAVDGLTASYAFEAGGHAQAARGGSTTSGSTPATSTATRAAIAGSRGNSGADIVVMLIIAVMLAAIGGGAAYAWREVHALTTQPGMGAGDDPIWSSGGLEELAPGLTASGEPRWKQPTPGPTPGPTAET